MNALNSLGILLRRLHHSSLVWRDGVIDRNGISRFSLWIVVIILCLDCTVRVCNKDNSIVGSAGRRGAGFAKDRCQQGFGWLSRRRRGFLWWTQQSDSLRADSGNFVW